MDATWATPFALLILAVLTAWAEPRRLAPGLLAVPALGLGALWVLGLSLGLAMSVGRASGLLVLGLLGLIILMIAPLQWPPTTITPSVLRF